MSSLSEDEDDPKDQLQQHDEYEDEEEDDDNEVEDKLDKYIEMQMQQVQHQPLQILQNYEPIKHFSAIPSEEMSNDDDEDEDDDDHNNNNNNNNDDHDGEDEVLSDNCGDGGNDNSESNDFNNIYGKSSINAQSYNNNNNNNKSIDNIETLKSRTSVITTGDSSNGESLSKKYKIEKGNYSDKSWRMMQQMGYKNETGLGKYEQGRVKPIEPAEQKGRRGLGSGKDEIDLAGHKWDGSMETIQLRETAEWLINDDITNEQLLNLTRDVLDSYIKIGKPKFTIEDETNFCDPDILAKILESKTIFDNLDGKEMRNARSRSNPFETIRSAIFLNRAAVKMANIDAIFDFMFTKPVDEHNKSLVKSDNDLLYFADVCAGPGGFSEYILWRCKWHAKGFGFTLRGGNDFKLENFLAGHPETFDTYYGINDDGNIFDPSNIKSLSDYVLNKSDGVGVHFMMADGGFSVEGKELIQEILSKQLYLCQCLVALMIVRENGHFVCKLFDTFTPFTVGLLYLMYKCFQQVCIFKPNTSRPANSERYLICKWKKSNTDVIYRHLFDINNEMFDHSKESVIIDTLELVPLHILQADEKFFNYICEHNNRIGRNQISGLLKIASYTRFKTLVEVQQSQIRYECLKIWHIPDTARKTVIKKSNEQLCTDLLGKWSNSKEFLEHNIVLLLGNSRLDKIFLYKTDWYFIPVDTIETSNKSIRTFFMSKGGRNVLMFVNNTWKECNDILLDITANTFFYGEIVKELKGEYRSQTTVYALHIIDGMILGGVDIRSLPYTQRIKMCTKFAKAINKPSTVIITDDNRSESLALAPLRCKQIFPFIKFSEFFDNLNLYRLKDGKDRYGMKLPNDDFNNNSGGGSGVDRFFVPRGLLFYNEIKSNLRKHYSKSTGKMYYCDTINNHPFYLEELSNPNEICSSFRGTYLASYLWQWITEHQVLEELNVKSIKDVNLLHRVDFNEFFKHQ